MEKKNKEENLFNKTLREIGEKKTRLEQGKFNTIAYPFPSLNKYFPGLCPETQQVLTTGSGIGKTWITLEMYVDNAYKFYMENKDKGVDVKVFHFALEDSANLVQKKLICKQFYTQFKERISIFQLNSYFEDKKISDKLYEKIKELESYFKEFWEKIEIIDNITNPTGIYKHVRDWMDKNGKHIDESGNTISANKVTTYWKDHPGEKTFYIPNNPDLIVLVAIDNMQNVTEEEGLSKWQSLDRFCRKYMRGKLCNYYKTCNLIIAQQNAEKEKTLFNNSGQAIEDKFMPSLDAISEYKNITHTAHIVYALFSPYKYKIEEFYDGKCLYPIDELGDHYRYLTVLKSNYVESNLGQSLFFDGSIGMFKEMPHIEDTEAMAPIWKHIEEKRAEDNGFRKLSTL